MKTTTRRGIIAFGSAALIGGFPFGSRGKRPKQKTVNQWKCAYILDDKRRPLLGSAQELVGAIRQGADLRIQTEFKHNEHIDTASENAETIQEVAELRVTYLLDNRWTAGIMTLRQPISLPDGFGARPSMSFFVYNQDGEQAIARPYLDGGPMTGKVGPSPVDDHSDMPKYHQSDGWDAGTNAPSSNFIYEFNIFKFWVHEGWEEVLAHSEDGSVQSGSVEALAREFASGREVKISIRGLCADLSDNSSALIDHELFVQTGSCYYYTEHKLFIAGSHPVVRVKPAIPLRYLSKKWDFGWLMARTDGMVALWLVDPHTLKFQKSTGRYAIRWFVR